GNPVTGYQPGKAITLVRNPHWGPLDGQPAEGPREPDRRGHHERVVGGPGGEGRQRSARHVARRGSACRPGTGGQLHHRQEPAARGEGWPRLRWDRRPHHRGLAGEQPAQELRPVRHAERSRPWTRTWTSAPPTPGPSAYRAGREWTRTSWRTWFHEFRTCSTTTSISRPSGSRTTSSTWSRASWPSTRSR